ncbi:hypothetical protein [Sphingopyxis fribergensis]
MIRVQPILATTAALLVVSGCSGNEPTIEGQSEATQSVTPEAPNETMQTTGLEEIKIRTIAGEPEQAAFLLPSKEQSELVPMAEVVRESGFQCDKVNSARQLQQNDKPMDVFKIDCANGNSFQATIMNDQSFLKPWTGVILGK